MSVAQLDGSRSRSGRLRVLLVEKGSEVGGSVISLHQLVSGLDRSRYEPLVLLPDGHPYVQRFLADGVAVMVRPWANRPPQGPAALSALSRARPLQRLRRSRWGRTLYHGVGFYLKAFPEIVRRARAFRTLVRQVRPDIVHLNDTVPINRGEILGGWMAGARMLIHARGFERLNHFDRWLCRRVAFFVFISLALRDDFLRQRGTVRADRVIYNGVDSAALRAGPEEAADLRRELGIPAGARVATMLGRIVGWKGQHVFVNALARLVLKDPDLYGLIVGAPERFSEDYARRVEALVQSSGLSERVRLCGFRSDVGTVLAASDVVVHASLEPEAFGRVIIEAMAAGRPVIGSRVGGVPELIEDGVNGLLVPPNDAAALAGGLQRVLDDREMAARLVSAGLQRVAEDFGIERHVAQVSDVYEALRC